MKRRISTTIENWLIPVGTVIVWEILGRTEILPRYLATPSAIAAGLWEVTRSGELPIDLAVSLYRVAVGFAIGTIAGILVGLGAGFVPGVRHFFDPLVAFLFAIPKVAFLPILLLLFGIGHGSKIALIAFSGFFPVFLAARYAVLSINPTLLWAGRNMGASPRTVFLRVVIPATAPQLFAGTRIALAQAFVVLFAAELIGSRAGLGTIISSGDEWGRFDLMFAGIVSFAVVGFACDRLLMVVRSRVLRGQLIGTDEQQVRE